MDREVVRLRRNNGIETIYLDYNFRKNLNMPRQAYRSVIVKTTAEGLEENFEEVEETAKAYMIQEAIREEKNGFRLKEIDRIRHSVIESPVNGNPEVEIFLEGIAIFKNPSTIIKTL